MHEIAHPEEGKHKFIQSQAEGVGQGQEKNDRYDAGGVIFGKGAFTEVGQYVTYENLSDYTEVCHCPVADVVNFLLYREGIHTVLYSIQKMHQEGPTEYRKHELPEFTDK